MFGGVIVAFTVDFDGVELAVPFHGQMVCVSESLSSSVCTESMGK